MSDAPLTPQQISQSEDQSSHEGYFRRVLVGFDQFMNVVTDGLPDETISSRAQRYSDQGNEFAKLLTKALDDLQAQHGRKAEAGDLMRAMTAAKAEKTALSL